MKENLSNKFFLYARKSSDESSNRQIASVEIQKQEMKRVAERNGLTIVRIFEEAKTGKEPGREIFNKMIEEIQAGKCNKILCWKLDRLGRNPVDEGTVRWLLQKGIIKEIRTYDKSFFPQDHTLITSFEMGMATQYSRDLRTMSFRNIRDKIGKGWRPGFAPLGYLNDISKPRGERDIKVDPERFDLIRKGWELLLTGAYPVSKIYDDAKDKWGLRTRKTRKQGGKPFSMSQWYKIFTDPFYYGWFYYMEPDEQKDDRERVLCKGSHTPMITKTEYDRGQEILGRKGKPQPKTREFSYSGLMRCGECGSAIVADEKNQLICSKCKYKFDRNAHKEKCPECGTLISEMENPKKLDYVYYRCSRRKNPKCTQRKYLLLQQLEAQIDIELKNMDIDEDYLKLALDYLNEKKDSDIKTEETIRKSLETELENCEARLKRLNTDYTSSINLDYSLYTPEEYKERKQAISGEKQGLEEQISTVKQNCEEWLELSEKTFNFCAYARFHLANGDLQRKREILTAIGQNLTLKDRKLSIFEYEPFLIVKNTLQKIKEQNLALEPKNLRSNKRKEEVFTSSIPTWLGSWDSNPGPIGYTCPSVSKRGGLYLHRILADLDAPVSSLYGAPSLDGSHGITLQKARASPLSRNVHLGVSAEGCVIPQPIALPLSYSRIFSSSHLRP
ncbi:MAG: hypothetical protein COT92_01890 [Candidatus Doudnabacteria bacterium CG10_big_fil_rev_8_21_14_0_10_42_18]|uniref:Resolvase/invertase-type recombinase catalytic domain-containing protein n=1 Tax=Candidatus Doudnabacteria bacterium CG10_big_fil_rev_8_21_14_0_10_42_18 TaxID=1974552 RepID=A0A2H0VB37_9BACT|nr:MAG: hypothetical protein COT92_01890 [Candidatus Doudnabacteria bacterium CG10_big_fil_rev_8_21_14_0_10_42_18]